MPLWLETHDILSKSNTSFFVKHYSLEGAAFQSRLPFEKMSSLEAECFSDLQGASSLAFVQIRNRILKVWFEDPKKQLTQEVALQKMEVRNLVYYRATNLLAVLVSWVFN